MALDVDAIWEALSTRLATVDGFKTRSRRRAQYGVELLPALLILDDEGDEVLSREDGLPPVTTLTGQIAIIAMVSAEDQKPTQKLNTLVRAVKAALERQEADPIGNEAGHLQYWTNLGGLVRSLEVVKVEKGAAEGTLMPSATIQIVMETNPG